MMREQDWLILQQLYQEKNITKAAKELFMSQPALSHRVQQIEKEFGVTLMHRGRRGVQFTPQGEYLALVADEILLQLRKIRDNVWNMDNTMTGVLRIGASHFFARFKLPLLLKLFKDRYPLVEFKVTTGWSHDVVNMVHNQEVHIGFVRGDYSWPEQKHLLFEETICIASQDKIQLSQLPHLSRVDYQTDALMKSIIDKWWRYNYSQPPLIGMEVDKVDTCKEMVANGLGYAILPSIILQNQDNLHTVNMIDSAGIPLLRRTWMYYQNEAINIGIIKEFVSFIKDMDVSRLSR